MAKKYTATTLKMGKMPRRRPDFRSSLLAPKQLNLKSLAMEAGRKAVAVRRRQIHTFGVGVVYFATLSVAFLSLFLGACQQRIFGVDEAIWSTLNEQEREKVIDGYNKRKEIELVNAQKQQEKELENERYRQEIEAETAPFYAAADAVSFLWGNSTKKGRSDCFSPIRIQAISSHKWKPVLTIGDEKFEVSPFSKMSQAWVKGQKVALTKNEDDCFYPVKIKNFDNRESVVARKTDPP
ncbi:MAG TPA: hypothetical protein VHL30_03770 [Chlamydiales bacterium]|jgi:hypothetical protein|nr:hypothetical protein [Chlamydiales bacterium]